MDFPVFHLDFLGNRMLIAVIAVLHVFINHSMAVGAMPLVTLMEWLGFRRRDPEWDRLAYRILTVCFIVTTSVGALTGVGIWLSVSLVNPAAIGSLIRVFFWAWFAEWIVFALEVVAIMAYTLTWRRMEGRKRAHIVVGATLSALSWVTMAIITAILGFMMDPGNWPAARSFLSALANPIYLPQLAFRTPVAMLAAGTLGLALVPLLTRSQAALRAQAVRVLSVWVLVWLPLAVAGALWYRAAIPSWMLASTPVAIATQAFASWYGTLLTILGIMGAGVLVIAGLGLYRPTWVSRFVAVVPLALTLTLLGTFERVREFIRKPFVISSYMHANGVPVANLPLFQEDGMLPYATYSAAREVSPANREHAGRQVFLLACTRCHTTAGVNSVAARLRALYGPPPWDRDTVKAYLKTMHNVRTYMPPFPGSDEEAGALTDYLVRLPGSAMPLEGAQSAGIPSAESSSGRTGVEGAAPAAPDGA
jgi:mono/diheme cytochrome c family protein